MSNAKAAHVGTPEERVPKGNPQRPLVDARLVRAAEIISGRWNLMILASIEHRPRRFTELLTGLNGISPNILTAKLRELEAAGVIERRHMPLPANCWVYQIADGRDRLGRVLSAMSDWVDAMSASGVSTRAIG